VIDVLLADDQQLVRAGLRMLLDEQQGLRVVGEATDGVEVARLARELRPNVVLMDIRMPRLDGIAATARVVADSPGTRVLVLTTFDRTELVYEALVAGASGFLLKDAPIEQLVAAIRAVDRGEELLAPTITRRLIAEFTRTDRSQAARALRALTEREREVLTLVARGQSNAEIAATLFLGVETVKTHVGRILAKLGLRDRVQAVVAAYEAGLVRVGDAAVGSLRDARE
jgi:DNA-binding NarL/FixJ family response regulator